MASKRDYYEILGVPRDADQERIKKAYRKAALDNHPDRHAGNKQAEQRFKEAAEAYSVLSDQEKRGRYDRFGHAAVDGAGGGAGFNNADDVFAAFSDLFGGAGGFFDQFFGGGRRRTRARRGASLRVDLQLTLEQVNSGVKKTLEITRPETCNNCGGSGAKPGSSPTSCGTCGGSGEVVRSQGFLSIRQACTTCRGQGQIIRDPCSPCRGTGLISKKAPIGITIPAGISEGHVERIPGQGEPGEQGGPPGDLVVVIHVQSHQIFTRRGDDLLAQAKISFRQAVLGDSVDLPTITGETVVLKIPHGTHAGDRLRVRGQGLPRADGYGKGNLLVLIQVEVPHKVTSKQEELLRQFDEIEESKHKKGSRKKGIFEKVKDIFA